MASNHLHFSRTRRHRNPIPPPSMVYLSDDELGVIFCSISDPKDRISISFVCKQWHKVECRTRTSIRSLSPNLLCKLLPRFPNLTSFESPAPIDDLKALCLASTCRKIETLNLNFGAQFNGESVSDDIGDVGLLAIAKWCKNISVLLLRDRKRVGDLGVYAFVRFSCNLIELDLSGCSSLTDQALLAVGLMSSVQILSLEGCVAITDKGFVMLSLEPLNKTLRKLVLCGCNQITDLGVVSLSKMECLEELNLADCGPGITELGGYAISCIPSLKKLDLSRLNVADLTLILVSRGCKRLVEMSINGCGNITGYGIREFMEHRSLEVLAMDGSCDEASIESVTMLVFGCASLRRIGLDSKMRSRIPWPLQEIMKSFCVLDWM